MEKYVYIIIKSKEEWRVREKEDREEIKKIINKYPIIGEIIGFAYKIITKKPILTRMGKGKGNPEVWVAAVKRGRIVCEVSGIDEVTARKVLKLAAYKLPMKTRVVKKGQELVNSKSQELVENHEITT